MGSLDIRTGAGAVETGRRSAAHAHGVRRDVSESHRARSGLRQECGRARRVGGARVWLRGSGDDHGAGAAGSYFYHYLMSIIILFLLFLTFVKINKSSSQVSVVIFFCTFSVKLL